MIDTMTQDERYTYFRQQLQDNICEVTFTKVNGEVRVMPCTLRADILPVVENKQTKVSEPKTETISVFCTDKKEWRSFRTMNVTGLVILN